MTLAPWLLRHLETTGRANTDGISRTLTTGLCRTCQQPVVRGLDDDRCALPTTCDPQPVDELGELLALATGRGTYDLRRSAGRYQIDRRHQWRISGRRNDIPVLAEHKCGAPLPTVEMPIPEPTTIASTNEVPF